MGVGKATNSSWFICFSFAPTPPGVLSAIILPSSRLGNTRKVIVPRDWFVGGVEDYRDIYLPHWVTL